MRLFNFGRTAERVGGAVAGVVEVFTPNAERSAQRAADRFTGAQEQFGAEFQHQRKGWFDRFVDALNRLPRPAMAFGTIGLFVFAGADPVAFAIYMEGLRLVPEPLWWLLGAVVSFYFGAREMSHFRRGSSEANVNQVMANVAALEGQGVPVQPPEIDIEVTERDLTSSPDLQSYNAALDEWRDSVN